MRSFTVERLLKTFKPLPLWASWDITQWKKRDRILLLIAFVLFLVLLWEVFFYDPYEAPSYQAVAPEDGAEVVEAKEEEKVPLYYYLHSIERHPLFKPLVTPPPPPRTTASSSSIPGLGPQGGPGGPGAPGSGPGGRPAGAKGASAADFAKNLSILATITGDDGLQAFILDKGTGLVELYKEGDMIGDLILETVRPDSVVLTYKGEKVTITF